MITEEELLSRERELKQKIRDHRAERYALKAEIDKWLEDKRNLQNNPVVKLTGKALNKKIEQIKTMLFKSKDMSASENEREMSKAMAEKLMKKHGIGIKDLNKNESKVNSRFGSRYYNNNYDSAYDDIYNDIFNNSETTVDDDLDDLENDVFSKYERDKKREREERGYW